MNGDINGTMAESKEVALPISSSPNNNADETKVTLEDCDENKDDCENSMNGMSGNTSENESIKSAPDNSQPEGSTAEASHQDFDDKSVKNTETDSSDFTHETAEIVEKQNHCENSSGSDPESTKSLHTSLKNVDVPENKTDEDKNNSSKVNGPPNEEDEDSVHEDDEYDSMAEEGSAISGDVRAEDTVSINSDSGSDDDGDETSRESQSKNRISDIIILDSENRVGSNNSDKSVHEIDTDNEDCVIETDKKTTSNEPEDKVQLRRSSRAIKRKRYTDDEVAVENGDESDVEEVAPVDPLRRKFKPIVINDTKTLVAMAAKQMRVDQGNNRKKDPTLVIIDNNSSSNKVNSMQLSKSTITSNSTSAQNLYQSIVARGTTVTPISSKNNTNSTQTSQSASPAILPSLTDDMFVVEAPSFIVPYVYEKPSITAFREFVDKLGKQLEEEKLQEQMKENEKREKEKQARRERGEEVDSDDSEKAEKTNDLNDEEANNKRKAKRERRRRNDDDDASWDGESLSETDDEALSDEDDKIVVKDKVEPIDQINVVADLTADKICSNKSNGKSSMDCSLGKFFINIGLNLVQEYVQSDLLKQQNRKLYKEKKAGHSTKATESSIAQLMKNLEFSKENNAPYSFPQEKCEFCSFKTESKLVMSQHLETPHMKNNVYKCNFCTFEIRSPHEILYHMEAVHNVRGRLERAPSYHQCANCPFEDNGKGKLARHLIACAKKFKPESNLAPPIDWEPPAKIPKIARPRNNVMSPYQNAFNRSQMGTTIRGPMNMGGAAAATANVGYRARGRSPMGAAPRPPLPVHGLPIMRGPTMVRPSTANNFSVANNSKPKSSHQPSISITPLPRQPTPNQHLQATNVPNNKNSFVICEICDGYIKDLEQLRNHMQWIHKVKIHPKMIYNRPPLNCQKCQFRFFTDQGFERHLLGSHGLVTSSMQEAANKGKDAGRCPVCGRVYQWKLLNHVARDHNLTLKPGHLSYKCTVCTATFGMYKQFENHVYSAHSVVAKKVMDKNKVASQPAKGNSDALLKPLKINEEITIIPQSVKSMATKSAKEK